MYTYYNEKIKKSYLFSMNYKEDFQTLARNFDERIKIYKNKETEINKSHSQLIAQSKQYNDICIYGAGIIARKIYNGFIRKNKINISSFLVSSISENDTNINGIPIIEIGNYKVKNEDVLIIVAVKESQHAMIARALDQYGFSNVVYVKNL